MSYIGKLTRGSKWWSLYRDDEGKIKKTITNDANKMADVNFFLERTTDENRKMVVAKLMDINELSRVTNGKQTEKFKRLVAEMHDLEKPKPKVKEEVKEIKSKEKK